MFQHSDQQIGIQLTVGSSFVPNPLMNDYEEAVLKILELALGNNYRYNTQTPLKLICPKNDFLEIDWWKFWANSTVDFVLYEKYGFGQKFPILAIECQSSYHDDPETEIRDRRKQYILDNAKIPLIQVKYLRTHYYRFYSHRNDNFVNYDAITRDGLSELTDYLLSTSNLKDCGGLAA